MIYNLIQRNQENYPNNSKYISSHPVIFEMEKEEKEREEGCCRNRTKTWQKGRTVAEIHVTGRVSLRLKIDQAPGAVGGGGGILFFRGSSFAVAGHPGVRG